MQKGVWAREDSNAHHKAQQNRTIPGTGTSKGPGFSADSAVSGSPADPATNHGSPNVDADLRALADGWASLPEAVRRAILAMANKGGEQ